MVGIERHVPNLRSCRAALPGAGEGNRRRGRPGGNRGAFQTDRRGSELRLRHGEARQWRASQAQGQDGPDRAAEARALMAERGRPSIYSDKLAAKICERLACGKPLAKICRDEAMPAYSTVRKWEVENK